MTKQEEKALNELDYLNVLMYSVVKQTNVDRMDAVVWAREYRRRKREEGK